jgi:hypothetical protein
MPVLEKVNKAQVPPLPERPKIAENWRFIISDRGRDTTFINYVVAALQPVVGMVYPDTYVRAPGMRFHPVYHRQMEHTGWDVVFKEPREFTVDQLKDRLSVSFDIQSVEEDYNDRSGNYVKFLMTPKFIKNASLWKVVLCHFARNGSVWKQGSTGASKGEHVHIGIRAHGQVV